MAYCTETDVARYITVNGNADIAGAIEAATVIVNNYTGDIFELTSLTARAVTNRAGVARLPYTASTIDTVALPTGETLEAGAWTFTGRRSSTVRLNGPLPYAFTIVGREPWATGRNTANIELSITGTFGHDTVPMPVREATAMLAAFIIEQAGGGTSTGVASNAAPVPSNVASITVEGYAVTYAASAAGEDIHSTGSFTVDKLLTPYRRIAASRWS